MNPLDAAQDLIQRGGFVMIPLFLCSIVSLAVMIERAVVLYRDGSGGKILLDRVRRRLLKGDASGAARECDVTPGPIARLLAEGIRAGHLDPAAIERKLVECAMAEAPALRRRLAALDTIVTVSPLLGLLGTVVGMIRSFRAMGAGGVGHPAAITAGVAEALIATATGLVIAIVTLIGYNALSERARSIEDEMELRGTQLVGLLTEIPSPVREEARRV